MHTWIYVIVSAAAASWLFITTMAILSVRKMTRIEDLLKPTHDPQRLEAYPAITNWAKAHEFELDSQFDFDGLVGAGGGIKMAIEGWYSPSRKLFLMHYHAQDKSYYEFVSGLAGEYGLVSSCSADSLSLPFPPKVFTQTFEGASLDELLEEHEKTLAYLEQRFGAHRIAPDRPLRTLIVEAVKAQMGYIQSLPLWRLRATWWHLVRRHRLKNRSVIDLIESVDGAQ